MKRALIATAALAAILCMTGTAQAVIGWAGNVWPNSGADVVPTGPLNVYAQVWKEGVTDAPGQGFGISAILFYTTDIAPEQGVVMFYNGDIGNNDEYTAPVPQEALVGATTVSVHVIFIDETDLTEYADTYDQAGNPPPQVYNVVNVLPNDITVTFTLCMSGTATEGAPCVIGSAPEIGGWGTGVTMTNVLDELWTVDVVFLAGGNPSFEYKYKKDACMTWENAGNRLVTLPTDGTTTVVLPPDSWDNQPIGCGLGEVLEEPKEICFQVCMDGVEYAGGVCVTGSLAELTGWGDGVPMTLLYDELYEACIVVPAGRPVPIYVEYKFKKDDCATWESVGNRLIVLDNTSPATQTATHNWEDGAGICTPPSPVEPSSWGGVKDLYR